MADRNRQVRVQPVRPTVAFAKEEDLVALSGQVEAMEDTLAELSENLGTIAVGVVNLNNAVIELHEMLALFGGGEEEAEGPDPDLDLSDLSEDELLRMAGEGVIDADDVMDELERRDDSPEDGEYALDDPGPEEPAEPEVNGTHDRPAEEVTQEVRQEEIRARRRRALEAQGVLEHFAEANESGPVASDPNDITDVPDEGIDVEIRSDTAQDWPDPEDR